MVGYKHLIPDPVFERDGLWYARPGDGDAVVLKHLNGTPIAGFNDQWKPASLYTGLEGMSFLTLEQHGAKASWMLAPDGRRLGDKLADLTLAQRLALRDAALERGWDQPGRLVEDAIQFIEPSLLDGIIALAANARKAAAMAASAPHARLSQRGLSMLSAPCRLERHLHLASAAPGLRLGEGWSDGPVRRTTGTLSVAHADIIPAASRYLLSLSLAPLPLDGTQSPCDIEVAVNGTHLGVVRLDAHWQAEGADFAFWLPPEQVAGCGFHLALRHEQDFILDDLRLDCGRSVAAAEPAPRDLMLRFENIGDNCEFGLVQRHYGAEPVGLLRFAGLRTPRRLMRLLEDDFGALGQPGSLGTTIIGGEYWITDTVYGIAYHTFRYTHEVAEAEVIRENETKALYLKRKLREDLEDGEKILVYKRVVTQDPHEMLALHAALNRFGTINPLLWVTEADRMHPPGSVEWIGDRLLKGYVGRISLEYANDFDPEIWLTLCRNALAAFEAVRPG